MAFGYVSRTSSSIRKKDDGLYQTIVDNNFASLTRDFKFRYLAVNSNVLIPADKISQAQMIYDDRRVVIYDLAVPNK